MNGTINYFSRKLIFLRWLILKDTYLIVIRPRDGVVREVILLDNKFHIKLGFYKTGRKTGITIINQTR